MVENIKMLAVVFSALFLLFFIINLVLFSSREIIIEHDIEIDIVCF